MALPMPVASRMQPRKTKIGTDSRMMLDMPSSMRPIITKIGTRVLKARKASVPMPKQKAIGTPMTRHSGDDADEEDENVDVAEPQQRGRQKPERAGNGGDDEHAGHDEVAQGRCPHRLAPRRSQHGENAERRWPRRGSCWECSRAGGGDVPFLLHILDGRLQHDEQERRQIRTRPRVWMKPWRSPGNIPRNSVSLRCSFRSMAMAEPSMASQRNEIEATSSIQTTG